MDAGVDPQRVRVSVISEQLAAGIREALAQVEHGQSVDLGSFAQYAGDDRHGGPDAGWYRPGPDGWQRVTDAEAWQHEDAAHFMSDPNASVRT
jgi:hypothetical protein